MPDNSKPPESQPSDGGGWAGPLRLHLSIVFVLLLVSIALPLIWLSYEQGTRLSVEAATQKMRLLSRHAIDRYRGIYGDGFSATTMASVSEAFATAPPADLDGKRDFLLKALAGSAYIDGIYAGYPNGDFVHAVSVASNPAWKEVLEAPEGTAFALRTIEQVPSGRVSRWTFLDSAEKPIGERSTQEVNYDPRKRPWYKAAVAAETPITVGPYVMATTNTLGLTVATRTKGNGDIVVGADVLLETISRLLAREAVSEHASGYVFDARRRLIVHSDEGLMQQLLVNLTASGRAGGPPLDDPALQVIGELLNADRSAAEGTIRATVDGKPYLIEISPFGSSGGIDGTTVVIAAPLSDFTAESERLLRRALIISAALLVAGIAAALVISRLVSNSLLSLAGAARHIGDLEVEESAPMRSRIAEINTLGGALDSARRAIQTFALYVPRELVRKIVASGQAAGNADRLEVTVLFTDIRDFTTISERHAPEDVVSMLSSYFQVMNDVVERHNGVIVQYLGDSIYAMWNAPIADTRHVDHACRCVLALKAGIDELNRVNLAEGRPELVTRFGLHTGVAVVGNVGARTRLQYTAMGDTINVASRLEGLNKEFGTSILASRAVADRASPAFDFRSLGLARVKGRAEQIEVFELTGA